MEYIGHMNRITITEQAISHNEMSKINFAAKDKKRLTVFAINLLLINQYLRLDEEQRQHLKEGHYLLPIALENTPIYLKRNDLLGYFVIHVSSNTDISGKEIDRIHKTEFLREAFWKNYGWIQDAFKQEGWEVRASCPNPEDHRIWLSFSVLPQKVSIWDLLDI